MLNTALDNGINFFDTPACYGDSEELVGRTVADRRDEYVLSTKAGHAVGDYDGHSWTADPAHMKENLHLVEQMLPISEEAVKELQRRFDQHGLNWSQKG